MSEPKSRPTFLTILCILTIMSAISGLWSQSERFWNPEITAENTRQTFESLRERFERQASEADMKTMEVMFDAVIQQTTTDSIRTGSIVMLIFESLCLYAAYQMWNLQKKGYYLYLAGIGIAFLAPLLLIGGWLGTITSLAGILVSSFMAIMYALNLKYMH